MHSIHSPSSQIQNQSPESTDNVQIARDDVKGTENPRTEKGAGPRTVGTDPRTGSHKGTDPKTGMRLGTVPITGYSFVTETVGQYVDQGRPPPSGIKYVTEDCHPPGRSQCGQCPGQCLRGQGQNKHKEENPAGKTSIDVFVQSVLVNTENEGTDPEPAVVLPILVGPKNRRAYGLRP